MLRQEVRDKCETIVRQYEEYTKVLQDEMFCRDYGQAMKVERTRQELEPVVSAYRNYQQMMIDVTEGVELLKMALEQERSAAQDFVH